MLTLRRNVWLIGIGLLSAVALAGCLDQSTSSPGLAPPDVPADTVLRQRIDDIVDYSLHQRLMNTDEQAAWQIVHGIEAFGPSLQIEHDGKKVSALNYLLQGGDLKGWILRPADHGIFVVQEPGSKTGEGHPDQWLGYLSQCGVKLDDPLIVGGKPYHVRDILTQAQWDIYDGMEATWTLMAVATYLPLDAKWQAKDGTEWSFERLVKMEAGQPLGSGGCGGSHRLYALALAMDRYFKETGKEPEQLEGGWKAAYERVSDGVATVKEFQQPDGCLSTDFFDRVSNMNTAKAGIYSNDLKSRIYSGGHTLEFLCVALDRDQLAEPWVTKAVVRLCDLMEATKEVDLECGSLYHASHALRLYREARFGKP